MSRTTTVHQSMRVLVPEAWTNDQKGEFLEDLAGQVLRRQSYDITSRIHYTGMEIDLLAKHRPSGDDVYAECKFLDRPFSANVVDLMLGQAFRRKISRLALFSTSPPSKGAAGALDGLRTDARVSFSYYGPDQLLQTMIDAGVAPTLPNNIPTNVSHATLLVYPEMDYLWLLQEQQDGRPHRILVITSPESPPPREDELRALLDRHSILDGCKRSRG